MSNRSMTGVGELFRRLAEAIVEEGDEAPPPLFRIRMIRRPDPTYEFDIVAPEPREGLVVVDMRSPGRERRARPDPLPDSDPEPRADPGTDPDPAPDGGNWSEWMEPMSIPVDVLLAWGYRFEVEDDGRIRVHSPPGHDLGFNLKSWVEDHRKEICLRFGPKPPPIPKPWGVRMSRGGPRQGMALFGPERKPRPKFYRKGGE